MDNRVSADGLPVLLPKRMLPTLHCASQSPPGTRHIRGVAALGNRLNPATRRWFLRKCESKLLARSLRNTARI